MIQFARLFHRYIVRDLLKNRARVALTISGVALGISVVVAVELANDRAIGSFNDSVQMLAGNADLQISANGLGLPETLIQNLSWVWDYGVMMPVVEGRAILDGQPVQVYGFDLLAEKGDGDANSSVRALDANSDYESLFDPKQVIISEALATRFRLRKGASLELVIGDRREAFVVGSTLADEGVAKAFSGNVIFMDIAAAQLALRKLGTLDRIDINLQRKDDLERVRSRIEDSLPPTAAVDRPESAALNTEKLLRAFRYNLTALSYISLIVGVILVYNTLTIAVIRRRSEIGMLRTMGVSRKTIAALFLLEAGCLGLVGAALGILFGEVMARAAGVLVTRTIEGLYTGVFIDPAGGVAATAFYAKVLGLGMALSMASGLAPALHATTLSPVTVLRQGIAISGSSRRNYGFAGIGVVLIGAASWVARQPTGGAFPFFGYAAALLLIVGFGALAPGFSQLLVRVVSKPLRFIIPLEGRLATQSMRANQGRIVTAVLSLGIAIAMLVSVVTMVSSFRDTVVVWINQTLRADLYIRAGAAGPNDWSNPFDPTTVNAVANLPGVAAIDRFRGRALELNGNSIVLAAGEFKVMSQYSDQLFIDGRSASTFAPRMVNERRVIVSEPFSLKQRLGAGDAVLLPTPQGVLPFVIEDVYYDYSNDRGTVVMDRSTYLQLFRDPSVTNIAVYLKPGIDPAETQRQIAQALPNAQLRVLANADLKRQVLRVFDQTFQVTYALEAIALFVAILGITNTLSALILERRPEFAMLRFVGVDRRQLRRLVVLESGLVGVIGAGLGFALGIALSLVLVFVINKQSFGWTIQFVIPGWFIAQSLAMILTATTIAGLYPAALATRMDAIQGIRAE